MQQVDECRVGWFPGEVKGGSVDGENDDEGWHGCWDRPKEKWRHSCDRQNIPRRKNIPHSNWALKHLKPPKFIKTISRLGHVSANRLKMQFDVIFETERGRICKRQTVYNGLRKITSFWGWLGHELFLWRGSDGGMDGSYNSEILMSLMDAPLSYRPVLRQKFDPYNVTAGPRSNSHPHPERCGRRPQLDGVWYLYLTLPLNCNCWQRIIPIRNFTQHWECWQPGGLFVWREKFSYHKSLVPAAAYAFEGSALWAVERW